jgi:hypothetical protein
MAVYNIRIYHTVSLRRSGRSSNRHVEQNVDFGHSKLSVRRDAKLAGPEVAMGALHSVAEDSHVRTISLVSGCRDVERFCVRMSSLCENAELFSSPTMPASRRACLPCLRMGDPTP